MYMLSNVIYVDFKKRTILNHSTNSITILLKEFVVNIFSYVKRFFDKKKITASCKRIQN